MNELEMLAAFNARYEMQWHIAATHGYFTVSTYDPWGYMHECGEHDTLAEAISWAENYEPPEPDLMGDGPAERAHQQELARRLK